MIPILSSILITCTPNDVLICDTSVNQNRSSLLWAENRLSQTRDQPSLVSDSPLSTDNYRDNAIPVPIENPPQTKAKLLGKPLKIPSNPHISPPSTKWKKPNRVLVTKNRQGATRQFEFEVDSEIFTLVQENQNITENNSPSVDVVEILADQQEYLEQEKIIKAKGNVVIRFSSGILIADQVLVNLVDRVAVAQDNVNLKRGEQVLRGDPLNSLKIYQRLK